ncbi:hypothetical protein BX616_010060 [Lobosporangium transversale]|uniref:C2H2-type domain-containing protein n=1 Tax=Lobosporangium transversale TaxID=64571 RepID=A0A1Y2GYA9_9FUNG|nr:hypothetical protein BCR41DRAFT_419103 [Lobosporangium transversale]KAF9913422.1 hypothetical protein BX616_010060 [Lobosporangium transversale]ORZ27290.1 hypothetical protein BCR41DRAFT_419103 [Lobosporangium transversale]|eukprot:XP_021885017.1 hypothetical protein BCR41DRAFT_419103 [Lobosporangium transversale]
MSSPNTAIATVSRPESQDTISHSGTPSQQQYTTHSSNSQYLSVGSQEPRLKKEEDSSNHQMNGVHLHPETDHDEDSEAEAGNAPHEDADEEDDGEDEDPDQDREDQKSDANGKNNTDTNDLATTRTTDDADLSLSSDNDDEEEEAASVHPNDEEYSNMPEETVCRWKDCGKVLPSLSALVIHLSDEHIGWKKTSYTCEWEGCSRKPIAQTTRFALISHMRSHTKHKPYDCPVPECDKSFSRSDAMAKHLKCQHGDVPERFTGRKSRGRYTMKDPAASSTLLPSSSFGAKKRRHHESSRSDPEMSSTLSTRLMSPSKRRKLGSEFDGDHRHYHQSFADALILKQLDHPKRGGEGGGGGERGRHLHSRYLGNDDRTSSANQDEDEEEDDDAEDSDFAVDNGQTPKQRYGILKAKFRYIYNERESLESEYEDMKKKLTRLRVERELLLDALLASDQQYQDPSLQEIEDSD